MAPIATHKEPGQHEVAIWQRASGKFVVTYGMQTKDNLTYSQAAREYGSAVMHACACAGLIVDTKETPRF